MREKVIEEVKFEESDVEALIGVESLEECKGGVDDGAACIFTDEEVYFLGRKLEDKSGFIDRQKRFYEKENKKVMNKSDLGRVEKLKGIVTSDIRRVSLSSIGSIAGLISGIMVWGYVFVVPGRIDGMEDSSVLWLMGAVVFSVLLFVATYTERIISKLFMEHDLIRVPGIGEDIYLFEKDISDEVNKLNENIK